MTIVQPALSIAAVERETGLSKDVLRKWESRYGFPAPLRDDKGERVYPAEQVGRLRLIKRLMDAGLRPARIVGEDEERLAALARERHVRAGQPEAGRVEASALKMLRVHDPDGLRQHLRRLMLRQGLARFVLDTIAPLNHAVGEAWARGELDIHEEHLYTDSVQWVLRDAIASVSDRQGRPRVLLTTLPEEPHGLGILMVAALFALEGAYCISLGTQTPAEDIARAVRSHGAEVVVLSFSIAYPQRRVLPALEELRQRLGGDVRVWAGGAGTARLSRAPSQARLLPTLEEALRALAEWRAERDSVLSS